MKRLLVLPLTLFAICTAAPAAKDDDTTIVHVLNRIGFGPRAGDVDHVKRLGLQRYIDEQLRPDRIADAAMAPRLERLTTIGMSSREIAELFERPAIQARQQQRARQDAPPEPPSEQQRILQRRAISVTDELGEQKLLRAIYSERQLQEVLVDFWFNHFNVDARKGPERFMLTEYERDAIRPHVLGTFHDLLVATAKSPAMLFYLDNWMSADPSGPHLERLPPRIVRGRSGPVAVPRQPRVRQGKNAPKGLNENYARELMELHTLGVDGGYTQKDVTEVARAFTGWTIDRPRQGGGFTFDARLHDPGEKIVLGHRIKEGGGIGDGERVLDILEHHSSTARFIATKLVRRFVSDTPPPALVARAAARFQEAEGDLRQVMRTILTSPEFLSDFGQRDKVKTPFEFVVSAVRTLGTDVIDTKPLVRALQQLGMPLYQCQLPTGYKDTADAWVNTGALVARMNLALRLANNDNEIALSIGGPEFQRK
jgi:uncharacterized protein (DUF1800 family)